ncbi:MAG: DUF2274 domain-containing protein [Micropepsaceae bacterium]
MSEARPVSLRLPKLPDRALVKMTITVDPGVHTMLQAFAKLYRETYGSEEPLTELVPYMLKNFLESDRSFLRARTKRAALPKSE